MVLTDVNCEDFIGLKTAYITMLANLPASVSTGVHDNLQLLREPFPNLQTTEELNLIPVEETTQDYALVFNAKFPVSSLQVTDSNRYRIIPLAFQNIRRVWQQLPAHGRSPPLKWWTY
jgi:hypothetical protein